jgi:murein DD-endopeptidase MepM/ murein hydrolase activator NlpD
MHKFLLVIAFLLLTSCASKPYSKYLSPEKKIQYLANLEQTINAKTNSDYGHIILQYDLIGLGAEGEDAYGSKLYKSLIDPDNNLNRLQYKQRIRDLDHQIHQIATKTPLLEIVAKSQVSKASYFKTLAKKLPIPKIEKNKFLGKSIAKKKSNIFAVLDSYESHDINLENLKFIQQYLSSAPLLIPMKNSVLTSDFGARKNPFNKKPSVHNGIDLQGPSNAEIYASAAGIVKFASEQGSYGKLIIINNGYGYTTYYAHLSEIKVSKNDKILPGQLIATQGNSGKVTNAHLHYEIRYNDVALDPSLFMIK